MPWVCFFSSICEAQKEVVKVSLCPALQAALSRVDYLVTAHLGMGSGWLEGRSWPWWDSREDPLPRGPRSPFRSPVAASLCVGGRGLERGCERERVGVSPGRLRRRWGLWE